VGVSVACAAGGGGGGGGGRGVLVATAPGTKVGAAEAVACTGLRAVSTGVAVGGSVGVKVGRSPRVGSAVTTVTGPGEGEPNSAEPTQ
jgi:hypothetical protein